MRLTNNQKEGHAAGALWAVRARREKLRLLEKLWTEFGRDIDSAGAHFCTRSSDPFGAAERLYFRLHPDQEGDRDAALAFYRKLGCETLPGDRFVRGFIEGAIQGTE